MGLNWTYKGEELTEELIGDNVAFVYIITNLINNKKYIGKKLFQFSSTKMVKGKKKRCKKTSDYAKYYGSNTELKNDVVLHGKDNFKREILHLCKSKGVASYLETKEQIINGVLESDDFYNSWIMCRVRKDHLNLL